MVTEDTVREAAEEHLGRKLSPAKLNAILARLGKALDWLDWTPYLDEAIRLCQKNGQVGTAADPASTVD